MDFFSNKTITKKIIVAILMVMLINFISPTISNAKVEDLFTPICQLLCSVADAVLAKLHEYFTGQQQFYDETVKSIFESEKENFNVIYSPGIIFSNRVLGLNINFFNPPEHYKEEKTIYSTVVLDDFELYENRYVYIDVSDEEDGKVLFFCIKYLNTLTLVEQPEFNFNEIGFWYYYDRENDYTSDNVALNAEKDIVVNAEKVIKDYIHAIAIKELVKVEQELNPELSISEIMKKENFESRLKYKKYEIVQKNPEFMYMIYVFTVVSDYLLNYNCEPYCHPDYILKLSPELMSTQGNLGAVPEFYYQLKLPKDKYDEINNRMTYIEEVVGLEELNKLKNNIIRTIANQGGYTEFYKYENNIQTTNVYSIDEIQNLELMTSNDLKYSNTKLVLSTPKLLQPTISKWYKSLRAIALVGLLSVLVYIGIRILISSTGEEKAKYKKMIGDWLAAILLLFILQYIMIFIIEISETITEFLAKSGVIGPEGQDTLMTKIRNDLVKSPDFSKMFSELVIYLVLVIFTVIFTVQYLKRLVYIAFFTMIAPLVTLTYPLDKMKDGKAQAFSIWLREYIFNSLLQPMHLLLYVIFVGSATELVEKNPVYALVAIGFMVPAEKFFRKMFGFDNAESSKAINAAAGGALIMSGINKLKGLKGLKGKKSFASNGGAKSSTPRFASDSKINLGKGMSTKGTSAKGKAAKGKASIKWGQQVDSAKYGKRNIKNGAKTLAKTNGKRILTGTGKLAKRIAAGTVGLAGAATLGTVGLAAGIATGDASKAFTYGAAGAGAGFAAGNALGNTAIGLGEKAVAFEKENREAFKEGALGTDEYNTRNTIKELNKDSSFNDVCKDLKITDPQEKEELIRHFYSNGIQDPEEIKKALNIRTKTGASQKEIIAAQKIRNLARSYGMKRKDIEELLISNGVKSNSKEFKRAMDIMDQL